MFDGLDFKDSIGNFYFAKMNLSKHGQVISKSSLDDICDSILKDATGEKNKIYSFERGAEMKLSKHPWTGRIKQREAKNVSSSWPDADYAEGSHYADAHPFHKKHHILRQKNTITKRNRMTEKLRRLYLPSKPGKESLAEQYKVAESGKERYERKKNNPSIVGKTRFNSLTDKQENYHPFLGPLHDSHLHDIYMNDFERWKSENPEIRDEMIKKFPNTVKHEHALRLKHFEDAADKWESDEHHGETINPKDKMTEQEIQDHLYNGKPESELDPIQIKEGLGYDGYLHGLEFLNPIDRDTVMTHINERGTDSHEAQKIKLSGGQEISAGRIKRNLAQRFTGEFQQYHRAPHIHGANIKKHYESNDDIPDGENAHMKQALNEALQSVPFDSENKSLTSVYDNLLTDYNERLSEHKDAEMIDQGVDSQSGQTLFSEVNALQQLPYRGMKNGKKIHKGAQAHPGGHSEGILQELQTLDQKPSAYLDIKTLMNLCGYNEDGSEIPAGEHPLLPNHDEGPLVSKAKIAEVIKKAKDISQITSQQKPIRNHDSFHHLGVNGPDLASIPVDEREHWLTDSMGNPKGLGAHFAEDFHYQGGEGRSVLSKLEMMHDSLPKDDEGYSSIGRVEDDRLVPNPKTIGLWGRYIPSLYDRETKEHAGAHGITSFWDASSHLGVAKPRNSKNMPYHGLSSLSGGYGNKVRYMTTGERKAYFNGKANSARMDGSGYFTSNAINAIGGMGSKTTQSISNSQHKHRLATQGGRLEAPHAPLDKKWLGRKQITADTKLSHSQGQKELFSIIQGHKKKKGGQNMPSGEFDNLSSEQQDSVEALDDEYDLLSESLGELEPGTDEYATANARLYEIDSQMESIYSEAVPDDNKMWEHTLQQAEIKDGTDLDAIVSMAQKMKPEMLKQDKDAFDPSNPEKFLANSSRLLRDANIALLRLPHEAHGFNTHGYDEDEIEHKSASELLSQGQNEIVSPHHTLAATLAQGGVEILPTMSQEKVRSLLGLPNDSHHNNMIERLMEGMDAPVKVLKHGDVLGSGANFGGNVDLSQFKGQDDHHEMIDSFAREHERTRPHHSEQSKRKKADRGFGQKFNEQYSRKLGLFQKLFRPNQQKALDLHGLSHVSLTDPVEYRKKNNGMYGKGNNAIGGVKGDIEGPINNAKSGVHDLFVWNQTNAQTMEKVVAPSTTVKQAGWGHRPIHPAGVNGHSVQDMFISGGIDNGYEQTPSVGFEFPGNKMTMAGTNTESQFLHSVPQPILTSLHGHDATDQVLNSGYQSPVLTTNMNRPNILGLPPSINPNDISTGNPTETLTVLMNPDALLKGDKGKPPPMLPMHRIFSLKDFEALRGFSGDWVVSSFYDGKRMMLSRKGGRVTSYDENNEPVALSDDDKKQFKALTDKDYIVDAVKMDGTIHIIDIVDYDGTNVADMDVRERLKVLRGQFDSHEHILIPGPYDTRMTEEGGLEATVKNLQEEHSQLLLRDAKSTYMLGERRHPKWFLLRGNKNVSFIILDVRGKGPYTYRLGAGPLDSEGFGNRGVDYEGKQYLDVGTITSPKPFNEGDTVSVSVSGVKKRNRNGKTLYDVTSSKIAGEASAESPASLETLSLLAKSHPVIHIPYDIVLKDDKISIVFDGLDEVIYKAESSHSGNWAHSPKSVMGDLSHSDYTLQLAESVRPLWTQAVSLMIKGVEPEHSMNQPKDRKRSEKESAGVIEAESNDNILKPQMAKTLARIAELTERIDNLQKEKMTGGPGARGMGINVGSAIESPRGPTSLMTEQSVPDWDMIDRPTEDSEPEYASVTQRRLKQKKAKQSPTYEAESEDE